MSLLRFNFPDHRPYQPDYVAIVDQYKWRVKDTNQYHQDNNGIGMAIYDVNGEISRTLPLDQYPQIHQQIGKQNVDLKKRFGFIPRSTGAPGHGDDLYTLRR